VLSTVATATLYYGSSLYRCTRQSNEMGTESIMFKTAGRAAGK